MNKNTCTRLPGLLLLAALSGCAWRTYTPAPLDLPKAAELDAARRLDDSSVQAALAANGQDTAGWPNIIWNRDTLTTALLNIHPEQRAARAKVIAALTRIQAGLKPSAPELTTTMEHHSQTGDGKNSPWAVGAGLQWELVPASVKSALNQAASIESQEVQLTAGDTAWRLYRALGVAMLDRQLSLGRVQLAATGLELALAREKSVAVRERYGVAGAMEVQLTAQRLQDARREFAEADAAKVAAQAQLATALAVSFESLNNLRMDDWPVPEIPDAASARQLAQTGRATCTDLLLQVTFAWWRLRAPPWQFGVFRSKWLQIPGQEHDPAGGTAPDIAGKDLANPIAQILSVALMLRYSFRLEAAAVAIETAVSKVIESGLRTGDIYNPAETTAKKVGTRAMGEAIAAAVG
jgi:hypothetical protein